MDSFYAGQMADTIGTPGSLGSMKLKGTFLADRKSGIYFPIPLDLVTKKTEKENKLYSLEALSENSNFISNTVLAHHLGWVGSEDVEPETSGKLHSIYMKQYLLGKWKPSDSDHMRTLFVMNLRLGLDEIRRH